MIKDIRFSIRIDKEMSEKWNTYCMENDVSKVKVVRKGIHLLLERKNKNKRLLWRV